MIKVISASLAVVLVCATLTACGGGGSSSSGTSGRSGNPKNPPTAQAPGAGSDDKSMAGSPGGAGRASGGANTTGSK